MAFAFKGVFPLLPTQARALGTHPQGLECYRLPLHCQQMERSALTLFDFYVKIQRGMPCSTGGLLPRVCVPQMWHRDHGNRDRPGWGCGRVTGWDCRTRYNVHSVCTRQRWSTVLRQYLCGAIIRFMGEIPHLPCCAKYNVICKVNWLTCFMHMYAGMWILSFILRVVDTVILRVM